ncbi:MULTISPECIES: hypothetical protein [Rhodanobacter]|uniref:Uncharacterized protein n=1 Tax=Rhodanobacter sp. IGA1.0 TaxID=3158582 RepID=A0AAU7QJ00_9GAMM|nr:hypothetical protein [Rhodanobacter spathiphylli]
MSTRLPTDRSSSRSVRRLREEDLPMKILAGTPRQLPRDFVVIRITRSRRMPRYPSCAE